MLCQDDVKMLFLSFFPSAPQSVPKQESSSRSCFGSNSSDKNRTRSRGYFLLMERHVLDLDLARSIQVSCKTDKDYGRWVEMEKLWKGCESELAIITFVKYVNGGSVWPKRLQKPKELRVFSHSTGGLPPSLHPAVSREALESQTYSKIQLQGPEIWGSLFFITFADLPPPSCT